MHSSSFNNDKDPFLSSLSCSQSSPWIYVRKHEGFVKLHWNCLSKLDVVSFSLFKVINQVSDIVLSVITGGWVEQKSPDQFFLLVSPHAIKDIKTISIKSSFWLANSENHNRQSSLLSALCSLPVYIPVLALTNKWLYSSSINHNGHFFTIAFTANSFACWDFHYPKCVKEFDELRLLSNAEVFISLNVACAHAKLDNSSAVCLLYFLLFWSFSVAF